ncbi:AAA family ATPase [Nanoarchaeota archaeon]
MKVIIISGTPSTGKSTLAKLLAKELNFERINLSKLIDEKKLCEAFDEKNQCKIIDLEKLIPVVIDLIKKSKKNLIIDSHIIHKLPKEFVDLCIITKTNLKELDQRLAERGYSKEKVRDNLDAEIFDVCFTEAQEAGHSILIVDTTHKIDKRELIKQIKEKLRI